MIYSDTQKRFLQELGRTEPGVLLIDVLQQAKSHYSSITTIDKTRPAEAQIEGRELFCKFIDSLCEQIKKQPHRSKPLSPTDYT